jgi:hypothetical protein
MCVCLCALSSVPCTFVSVAPRNVLIKILADLSLVFVLCDFGLSIRIPEGAEFFVELSSTALPFPWMALECFQERRFDVRTDVWCVYVYVYVYVDVECPPTRHYC